MLPYLGKGNTKLPKTVLIFNLPTVTTCPNCQDCKDRCYARKAERLYPEVLPCRNKNFELSKQSTFVTDMVYLISKAIVHAKKHKPQFVRVHEAGDFYSKEYADKWIEIAKRIPELQFYTYTKAPENVDWDRLPANFNVVVSILPDGEMNFGHHDEMNRLSKKYGVPICPYKRVKKPFKCMKHCRACANNQYVLFDIH